MIPSIFNEERRTSKFSMFIGNIINAAASHINLAAQMGYNAWSARQAKLDSEQQALVAYERNKEMFQNRYQWTVGDMKAAGLNPILALSSGFSAGSTPQIHSAQSFKADQPNTNLATGMKDIADAFKKDDERDLIKKQSLTEIEKRATERSKQGLMSAQEGKAVAEMFESEKRFEKIESEIEKIIVERQLTEKEKEKISVEIRQYNATIKALAKTANVYAGPLGQLLAYLRAFTEALGINVNFSGGIHSTTSKIGRTK